MLNKSISHIEESGASDEQVLEIREAVASELRGFVADCVKMAGISPWAEVVP